MMLLRTLLSFWATYGSCHSFKLIAMHYCTLQQKKTSKERKFQNFSSEYFIWFETTSLFICLPLFLGVIISLLVLQIEARARMFTSTHAPAIENMSLSFPYISSYHSLPFIAAGIESFQDDLHLKTFYVSLTQMFFFYLLFWNQSNCRCLLLVHS